MSYNPDQYSEPQAGLVPYRTTDKLFDLFSERLTAKYPGLKPSKWTVILWEKFRKDMGYRTEL